MKTPHPSSASLSRRDFISRIGLAAAAATFDIAILGKWFFDGGNGGPLKYTPEQMAQTLDEIGLDLELTARRQGHITPERIPDELPAMVAALAKKNRRIMAIALDTVRPDEPHWEKASIESEEFEIPQPLHEIMERITREVGHTLFLVEELRVPNNSGGCRVATRLLSVRRGKETLGIGFWGTSGFVFLVSGEEENGRRGP